MVITEGVCLGRRERKDMGKKGGIQRLTASYSSYLKDCFYRTNYILAVPTPVLIFPLGSNLGRTM